MKPARKRRSPAGTGLRERDYGTSSIVSQPTAPRKPFLVNVHGERVTAWGCYIRREDAEAVAAKLRRYGFAATVEGAQS